MSDLKIDVGEVLASASSAERIAGDFSSAERIADETASYTGHDGLAGKVRDFGGKWDIARGKLEDNLTFIADYLRAVVDTFEDLDTNLAASIASSKVADATDTTTMTTQELLGSMTGATPAPTPSPTPSPSPGPAPAAPATGGN